MFDLSQVRRGHQRFQAALSRSLARAADPEQLKLLAWRYVAQNSRFTSRTGNLVRKTGVRAIRTRGGRILRLVNTAPYAAAQDRGSGLWGPKHAKYPIRPRRKKALSFLGKGGGEVTVRYVMHPGVRPTRFLYDAAGGVGRAIRPWIKTAMTEAQEAFNQGNR